MADIERITFLVHPFCYAESLGKPAPMPEEIWRAYHEHEKKVAPRWYAAIAQMDEADMVVYHPCYQSVEEKALADYVARHLGDRFMRVRGREIGHQRGFTPEVLAALAAEIDAAFQKRGKYAWPAHDLRIAVFSHNYARDILALCAERNIRFDPDRVGLKATGESFEGCATTWTTMVPTYLNVPSRVEIPYELTVPDTFFLLPCRFVRRVAMPHHVALYLFIDLEGLPVAHYKRERVTLADPSFYARWREDTAELLVLNSYGDTLLPAGGALAPTVPPSLVRRNADSTDIMVASGRGRGGEGPPYYPREAPLFVSSQNVDPDAFFAMAERAEIVPEIIGTS